MARKPAERRRAELARIHIGRKALGLDEDAYRTLLREVGGQDSAGALNARGRGAVLDRMRADGAFGRRSPVPRPGARPAAPQGPRAARRAPGRLRRSHPPPATGGARPGPAGMGQAGGPAEGGRRAELRPHPQGEAAAS